MDLFKLLKRKEEELQRVQKELEAVRIVLQMVEEIEPKSAQPSVSPTAEISVPALSSLEKESKHGFSNAAFGQFP